MAGAENSGATALIEVKGLAKRFGRRRALIDIGLILRPGEVMGFVGPNGAGKTTTLRILAGLLKADGGEGHVLGAPVRGGRDKIRGLVGYMPQRLALYGELTVEQNLAFRAEVYSLPKPREAVAGIIDRFGLTDYAGQRAEWLSGGWARLLQFAASVIHGPKLILLDEPTAGLDAPAKLEVWRRIGLFAGEGAGIIVNTHDLVEAEQCDRVTIFAGGHVAASGDPASVAAGLSIRTLLAECDSETARRLGGAPGVIASYPQGRRLRLVVRPGDVDAVAVLARELGAVVEVSPPRLEDAEFGLASQEQSA